MPVGFTIRYIPLSRIKPDRAVPKTPGLKRLRTLLQDCMHLLAVRRSGEDGFYTLVSGYDRYEYLRKHTGKTHAPCIVDQGRDPPGPVSWIGRLRSRRIRQVRGGFPELDSYRILPASASILRTFLRKERRFGRLPRTRQLKVLLLAIRYKKTVLNAMKAKVDEMLGP